MNTAVALYQTGIETTQCRTMDISDIRRTNLRIVLDTYYDGKAKGLAQRLDKQPNEITRVFTPNPDSRRNVGDKLARSIESVTKLERGWMDRVHGLDDGMQFSNMSDAAQVTAVVKELSELDPEDLDTVFSLIRSLNSKRGPR